MATVHPTAVVDSKVELPDDVKTGAYAIIRGMVSIGPGTVIHEHTNLQGPTFPGRQ